MTQQSITTHPLYDWLKTHRAGSDETREILQRVYVYKSDRVGRVAVAADGHRLACVPVQNNIRLGLDTPYPIPFPDVDAMLGALPTPWPTVIRVSAERLWMASNRAMIFARESNETMIIEACVDRQCLILSAASGESGSVQTEIPAEIEGRTAYVGINVSYVLDALLAWGKGQRISKHPAELGERLGWTTTTTLDCDGHKQSIYKSRAADETGLPKRPTYQYRPTLKDDTILLKINQPDRPLLITQPGRGRQPFAVIMPMHTSRGEAETPRNYVARVQKLDPEPHDEHAPSPHPIALLPEECETSSKRAAHIWYLRIRARLDGWQIIHDNAVIALPETTCKALALVPVTLNEHAPITVEDNGYNVWLYGVNGNQALHEKLSKMGFAYAANRKRNKPAGWWIRAERVDRTALAVLIGEGEPLPTPDPVAVATAVNEGAPSPDRPGVVYGSPAIASYMAERRAANRQRRDAVGGSEHEPAPDCPALILRWIPWNVGPVKRYRLLVNGQETIWFISRDREIRDYPYGVYGSGLHESGCAKRIRLARTLKEAQSYVTPAMALEQPRCTH